MDQMSGNIMYAGASRNDAGMSVIQSVEAEVGTPRAYMKGMMG